MSIGWVFDTCFNGASFGVMRSKPSPDGEQLWQLDKGFFYAKRQGAAEFLAHQVQKERQGLGGKPVSLLALTHGPGSFTGVKIGLAFAQGLSLFGSSLPATGYSTLFAFAMGTMKLQPEWQACTHQIVILPCTRDFVFVGSLQQSKEELSFEEFGVPFADAESLVSEVVSKLGVSREQTGWSWLNSSWEQPKLPVCENVSIAETQRRILEGLVACSNRSDVLSISVSRDDQSFASSDLKPRYLRLSTAEERRLQQAAKGKL